MSKALQVVAVAIIAALMLLWNLGDQTLWQDEAATAVLAKRMLQFGKPLAYDNRNLITMDYRSGDESATGPLREMAKSAEAGVRFYQERGDYKADTTWVGQPWGQFVLAAASFRLFGVDTWQARFPFALCGVLTIVSLFVFVRSRFDSLTAWVAVLLLCGNVYWLLHMRQCRYYAPSSLLLWWQFVAYWRWQEGRPWGRLGFIVAAWLLFQCDYGVFVPVLAACSGESIISGRRRRIESLAIAAAIVLLVLPWYGYYELGSRLKPSLLSYWVRLLALSYSVNQFTLPVVIFIAAMIAAWFDRSVRSASQVSRGRLVGVGGGLVIVLLVWMAYVAPFGFHRYVVGLTPIAAWLTAYVLVAAARKISKVASQSQLQAPLALSAAIIVIVTPWLSQTVAWCVPPKYRTVPHLDLFVRSEFQRLFDSYLGTMPDPNKQLFAALKLMASPNDEILVNCDDIPFMFYTDHRIRGGISAFRIDDPSGERVVLILISAANGAPHWLMEKAVNQRNWNPYPVDIPSCALANCPDPYVDYRNLSDLPRVILALPADPPAAANR